MSNLNWFRCKGGKDSSAEARSMSRWKLIKESTTSERDETPMWSGNVFYLHGTPEKAHRHLLGHCMISADASSPQDYSSLSIDCRDQIYEPIVRALLWYPGFSIIHISLLRISSRLRENCLRWNQSFRNGPLNVRPKLVPLLSGSFCHFSTKNKFREHVSAKFLLLLLQKLNAFHTGPTHAIVLQGEMPNWLW